jgi:hypothetical protein
MSITAEAPRTFAQEPPEHRRPIRMRRSKSVILGAVPFGAGAAGLVSLAAYIHPGAILGTLLLAGELILGGLSLYMLWPKNKSATRR